MCRFVNFVSAFDSTSQHVQPFVVLREVFSSFDYKNTGTVEVDELRHAFALYDKYSDEEIDQIFAAVVSFSLACVCFC
jgi:Ca2+-binding EF-hand superfamily protein